jgi:GNAT superfamily N-acetyltransferase
MGSIAEIADGDPVETTVPVPIPSSELPLSTSSSITLVPAKLLERHQCWNINSHAWRGPLSVAQYIKRESFLGNQLLTQNGKITYWILTDNSLPLGREGARPILASCETLRKEGYLAEDGRLEKLVTHGIGSVFCRHEYRGRGYASRMMTEVGKTLETWQQREYVRASFSMLWSDIGLSFYAAHGWKAMPSRHISLPPLSQQAFPQICNVSDCSNIQDLFAQDIQNRLCPKAVAEVETQLQRQSQRTPNVPYVAICPDYDHMAWHHAREDFQARTLYNKGPLIKGAEDRATGCAVIWSRVYGEAPHKNKLHILHTVVPVDTIGDVSGSVAALLLRAQLEAREWDLHGGLELWNPAAHAVDAAQIVAGEEKVQISVRDKESVCSLKWIGGGDPDVQWLANEKYAWC